jgi:RimJ/RimL family protein N-acetyltransferase
MTACPIPPFDDPWSSRMQQAFETERLTVTPLSPAEARRLFEVLLQDDALAAQLPWLESTGRDEALREAFGIELQCAAGLTLAWGIVERASRTMIGGIVAKHTLEGSEVDILVASQFWDHGVAEEAGDPVVAWLQERLAPPPLLH